MSQNLPQGVAGRDRLPALGPEAMTDRIIPLEGVRNFRDFGGYASKYGGQVKRGHLYRSGHYAEASHADLERIRGLGIHLQADLRRPDERERQPGKWSAPHTLTHDGGREHEAPHQRFLQRVEANAEQADEWMNDYYAAAPFKPHHADLFTDWFRHLAALDGEAAGLVNCAAGKDRTGMAATLAAAAFCGEFGRDNEPAVLATANLLRAHGTRILICEKNTGRRRYAFNAFQREFLPAPFRPPPSTIEDLASSLIHRDMS